MRQSGALFCVAPTEVVAQGSTDLDHIQIIKKPGGQLTDSYLDEGFILDKKIGSNCPKVMKDAKILVANTGQSRRPLLTTGGLK